MEARRVIAINVNTGERRGYGSVYAMSKDLKVTIRAAQQAQERNGVCCGWRIYDTPERIRKHIAELQEQIKMLESVEYESIL